MSGRSDSIVCGNVHDFVQEWLEFVLVDVYRRNSKDAAKDWQLLESLSSSEYEAFSQQKNSNVISFQVNRKTQPQGQSSDRHVVRLINQLVKKYCVDSELTLPGFYAFLREMTAIEEQFQFSETLKIAKNALILGFWNKVRPKLYDVVHGFSDNMATDMAAIEGINQLTSSEENSAPKNDLDPKLPFAQVVQADLQQAMGSRPTPTPGLGL